MTMILPNITTASPAHVTQPGSVDTPTAKPIKVATIGSINMTIVTTTGSKYFKMAM
eukprot:CAMPEP_0183737470 /NCGR_PEP_ID=MMETSP0737-20130205/52116_1 /TAXON_ID=385413 /ORGANISM="Thalassiosira miniscula, Strain CCMP1093" /LENGTH=55 /DNA_ID=CAMNT_0025971759 /DNA_START=281 /DNA_END=448 /DNA_ORIENTATION=-